ncbi:lanthionine synthetase LanC family protein [Streptomyces sp. PTD5-9]|uniref:lanthionine synthetase LanC family protein n=1 Tax=Streptomyces sp. PTD5-9 TaxID=3120150 RepID=UPI00300AE255
MQPGSQAPPHRATPDASVLDTSASVLDGALLDAAVRLLDDFTEAGKADPDPGVPVLAHLVAEVCGPAAERESGAAASAPGAARGPGPARDSSGARDFSGACGSGRALGSGAVPGRGGIPGSRAAAASAGRAVAAWARTIGRGPGHCGLYDGGLAGTLVGLRLGARIHPPLHRAADRLRDHLLDKAWERPWRTADVGLPDYDLISGPSGTLLALCVGTAQPKRSQLMPYTAHLTELCDSGDLRRLHIGQYSGHPRLGRLRGRVNTGMGHGVAGLVTALTAAVRHVGPWPEMLDALRCATRWLVRQSFDDARSVRSWDGAGLDGPPPAGVRARQAWCYGNPGVTWALWDAADALGDRSLADWALEAFGTLAERYDEDVHLFGDPLTDRLGLCHGAAGVLVVADAFHRHARLPAAGPLGARLAEHLGRELPAALARAALGAPAPGAPTSGVSGASASGVFAPGEARSLLVGVPGALSALLTAAHDAPRDWLGCLGLR